MDKPPPTEGIGSVIGKRIVRLTKDKPRGKTLLIYNYARMARPDEGIVTIVPLGGIN